MGGDRLGSRGCQAVEQERSWGCGYMGGSVHTVGALLGAGFSFSHVRRRGGPGTCGGLRSGGLAGLSPGAPAGFALPPAQGHLTWHLHCHLSMPCAPSPVSLQRKSCPSTHIMLFLPRALVPLWPARMPPLHPAAPCGPCLGVCPVSLGWGRLQCPQGCGQHGAGLALLAFVKWAPREAPNTRMGEPLSARGIRDLLSQHLT